jgi:hypothetical protein
MSRGPYFPLEGKGWWKAPSYHDHDVEGGYVPPSKRCQAPCLHWEQVQAPSARAGTARNSSIPVRQ